MKIVAAACILYQMTLTSRDSKLRSSLDSFPVCSRRKSYQRSPGKLLDLGVQRDGNENGNEGWDASDYVLLRRRVGRLHDCNEVLDVDTSVGRFSCRCM